MVTLIIVHKSKTTYIYERMEYYRYNFILLNPLKWLFVSLVVITCLWNYDDKLEFLLLLAHYVTYSAKKKERDHQTIVYRSGYWMFLFGHFVWTNWFIFLIFWCGCWQELFEIAKLSKPLWFFIFFSLDLSLAQIIFYH